MLEDVPTFMPCFIPWTCSTVKLIYERHRLLKRFHCVPEYCFNVGLDIGPYEEYAMDLGAFELFLPQVYVVAQGRSILELAVRKIRITEVVVDPESS